MLYLKNTGKTDPGILISVANQIKKAINFSYRGNLLDKPSVSTNTRSGIITISNASKTMRGLIERNLGNMKVEKGRVPRFKITTVND